MKTALLNMAAASALCVAAVAYEAPQEAAQTDAASMGMESVTITARRFHMAPREFMDYEYAYNISNGDVVRFSRRVGRFYLAIKGQPTVEIFATAGNQFVSKDGAKLIFSQGGDTLTIDNYERIQMAAHLPVAAVADRR